MKGILVDTTRCTGCKQCVTACSRAGSLSEELPRRKLGFDGLSSRRRSTVVALQQGGFAKKQCLHCLSPACVDACPVGAMKKTELGPVVYDRDKCMGCRYCMLACPGGIPRYEWDQVVPYVVKCDLCHDRVRDGKAPACVAACPNGALAFGDRDALLRDARRRIAANPELYYGHVFGEHELGGTCVLYLGNQPLDALGWPATVGDRTLKSYTWPLISKTPWMALGVGSLLVGTQFIIHRRMKLASERDDPDDPRKETPSEPSRPNGDDE